MNMKTAFAAVFLLGSFLAIPAARAAVTPSGFELKIFEFAVSANEDCSNPIVVYSNEAADYTDMVKGPTFGSWNLADGTYKCVIFEMSDHIRFTPATNEGACASGQTYTVDVCRKHGGPGGPGPSGDGGPGPGGGGSGGSGGGSTEIVKLLDGTTFECQDGDVEERVAVYLSTASNQKTGSAFSPPTGPSDAQHGIKLSAPLVVNGSAVGTFTVDARGKVGSGEENGVAECGMDPPVFGFE